ncbi:cation-translocating P-type ATPase [Patescibacteria group bacterium]|nr:cation-translocating P-type ATPase [Patescibacteria group bacterium]
MDLIYSFKLNLVILFLLLLALLLAVFPPSKSLPSTSLYLIFTAILATSLVIFAAVNSLLKHKITVDQLASIALIVSFIHQEWLSVAFINLMIISARIFAIYTETKAKNTIKSLLKLRPSTVKVKRFGVVVNVPIEHLKVGDLVVIDSGDRVPVDGLVLAGRADLDQSSLTGESLPVLVDVNHHVYSSTLCLSGSLLVRADKVGADTTFQKIVKLVESAQANKVRFQTVAEKFASWYILITLVSSAAIYLISQNLNLVLAFLLVTCADDIAVAVPLAYWAAIANAAKKGIIIKGGNYLEALSQAKVLVTDKTGTLTRARLKVIQITPLSDKFNIEKILYYAANAESVSEHPIAKAIIRDARLRQIHYHAPEKFEEHPGGGITGRSASQLVDIGSPKYLHQSKHIALGPKVKMEITKWEKVGATTVLLAINHQLVGLIALEDEVKPEVPASVKELSRLGISRFVLLTGDNEYAAANIAQKTGIHEVYANSKPEDKVHFIERNIHTPAKLIYVGDGVNDAASLAAADVSFAMGAIGTDSAIESADIAIMDDKFSHIASTIKLAQFTKSIVVTDFTLWGIVNLIGLYLAFAGLINPSQAAFYNFVTDFLPLFNSFRLFNYSLKK